MDVMKMSEPEKKRGHNYRNACEKLSRSSDAVYESLWGGLSVCPLPFVFKESKFDVCILNHDQNTQQPHELTTKWTNDHANKQQKQINNQNKRTS